MADSPKAVIEKLNTIVDAWEKLRPAKKFGGMTLEEFKAGIKPSYDSRKEISDLEKEIIDKTNQRDDADDNSEDLAQLVVNGVKGDPEEGEDSTLYETMGYVRKSERKSGLKRAPAKKPAA